MKFDNKKEEFIYYSNKCKKAKENKDEKSYLLYLAKAKLLLEEIEEQDSKK